MQLLISVLSSAQGDICLEVTAELGFAKKISMVSSHRLKAEPSQLQFSLPHCKVLQ